MSFYFLIWAAMTFGEIVRLKFKEMLIAKSLFPIIWKELPQMKK